MDYDVVLFDLDGVLLEGRASDPAVYDRAAHETIAEFGLAESDGLRDALADPTDPGPLREVLEPLDVDPQSVWRHRERLACEIENERLRDGSRSPYPDADVLHDLAERASLGVVSNNRHDTVTFACSHFEFDTALETVQGRSPSFAGQERMKPDPYYLEQALGDLGSRTPEQASVARSRVLYVGDRESDLEAAARAGVASAFLRRAHNEAGSLDTEPEHVLDGLDELRRLV